jgi:hypothetical protein
MRKKNGEFPDHLILHCDVLMPFGLPFLVILGCHGLCLDVLSICTPTGGFLVVRRVLQCGRMTEVLREEILSLFFRTLYLWTIAYLTPLLISYNVFLTLFASSS